MTDQPETVRCPRCTMTFRVMELPWGKNKGCWRGKIATCAEPNCRKPFWYGSHRGKDNRVRVGILPEWLAMWGA